MDSSARRDKFTITVRFQYPSSTIDRMSRQKISKGTEALNSTRSTNLVCHFYKTPSPTAEYKSGPEIVSTNYKQILIHSPNKQMHKW